MKHQTIVIIDFETTGFKGREDDIIEIGALKFSTLDFKVIDTYQTFIKIDKPLPQKIIEITHINDGMLRSHGISREEAAQNLFHFIPEDAMICGYNIMFDLSFFETLMQKYVKKDYIINHDVLDVLTIFRDLSTTAHKLSDAVLYYQVTTPNTHRALDDVIATFEVLKKMIEKDSQTIETYQNIIGYPPFRTYFGLKLPHVKYLPQRSGMKDLINVSKL
jgi:DNA polymerase III epsilon subunit family exonuclease